MIALQDGRQWALKFTHGDLSSLNILARGDNIVGIIDWETAGFLPEYLEYTSACQVNPRNLFWREEVEKFIGPMPAAWEMGKIRRKYFGDISPFTQNTKNSNHPTFSLLSSMPKVDSSSVLKFPVPS
jgi:hypothetical protein